MFLHDDDTMELITLLTDDPSDENIQTVVDAARELLPADGSVYAEIELIAMAVEPVHPGITDRLRRCVRT